MLELGVGWRGMAEFGRNLDADFGVWIWNFGLNRARGRGWRAGSGGDEVVGRGEDAAAAEGFGGFEFTHAAQARHGGGISEEEERLIQRPDIGGPARRGSIEGAASSDAGGGRAVE